MADANAVGPQPHQIPLGLPPFSRSAAPFVGGQSPIGRSQHRGTPVSSQPRTQHVRRKAARQGVLRRGRWLRAAKPSPARRPRAIPHRPAPTAPADRQPSLVAPRARTLGRGRAAARSSFSLRRRLANAAARRSRRPTSIPSPIARRRGDIPGRFSAAARRSRPLVGSETSAPWHNHVHQRAKAYPQWPLAGRLDR
jgi:hypothetical protein